MELNWKKIYSTNKPTQAEILKECLKEQGIECVLMNKQDSSYLIGEIELFVPEEDEIKAIQIIQKADE